LAPPGQQVVDRIDQIAPDRAAQAARRHLDDVLVRALDQQVIDPDIAELVDDDGGVGEKRILQQEIQQRSFAGAKEAGEDRDGNGVIGALTFSAFR
jgi:hypothetical protein